jgi:hypothetical protein
MARQHPWVLATVPWSDKQEYTRGTHHGLPLLSWNIAPRSKLATYRQLRVVGKRPGGHGPVAVLYFRHSGSKRQTLADLYLIAHAEPVRPMTPAKWAAIRAALAARRICPVCGEDGGDYIRPSAGMCEACQYSRGEWDPRDVRHDFVVGEATLTPDEVAELIATPARPALVEIAELDQCRPAADAPVIEIVQWYERKAAMLAHLADDAEQTGRHPDEAGEYATWANSARRHATELLAGVA